MAFPKAITTVTPFSKTISIILFIFLPIIGFFYGRHYQRIVDNIHRSLTPTPIQISFFPTQIPTISHSKVSIYTISPGQGPIGSSLTIRGSGFNVYQNFIQFGAGYLGPFPSPNQTTIRFTIPNKSYGGCNRPYENSQIHCMAIIFQLTQVQSYLISVINQQGSSNSLSFQVTK